MNMKTVVSLLSVTAIICALAMPAAAQRITQGEVNRFNNFLSNHPRVAGDLYRNPGLVNNRGYLDAHPELHSFLESHDELRHSLQSHPGKFMFREGRYSWSYGPGSWGGPGYAAAPPAYWERMHNYGYWDERHVWHDRDWWEHNRRDWVEKHHPNWLAAEGRYRERWEGAEHERAEERAEHERAEHRGHREGDRGERHDHDRDHH